jgi:hypothetical protein
MAQTQQSEKERRRQRPSSTVELFLRFKVGYSLYYIEVCTEASLITTGQHYLLRPISLLRMSASLENTEPVGRRTQQRRQQQQQVIAIGIGQLCCAKHLQIDSPVPTVC